MPEIKKNHFKSRNILRLFFAFACFILLCKVNFSYAAVVDKILIIVNDEIITQGELDRFLEPIQKQYKTLYSGQELEEKIQNARKNVTTKLINDKLLLTEARRRKIEITDDEMDKRLGQVRKNFQNEEEFKVALARENIMLSDFIKKQKERMMIDRLIDEETRGKVSISPNELVKYYESHKDEFNEPKKVKIKSILIRVTEERPEGDAMKTAKEIIRRLKEGGNFGLLAREYSDGPYAPSGGEMGWVRDGELMEKVNKSVFSLDENEVSSVIKTDLGLHIFMVEEKMAPEAKDFNAARGEIEQILFNKQIDTKIGRWIEQLKKNAYIAFR